MTREQHEQSLRRRGVDYELFRQTIKEEMLMEQRKVVPLETFQH
jgi:hypothetical protein